MRKVNVKELSYIKENYDFKKVMALKESEWEILNRVFDNFLKNRNSWQKIYLEMLSVDLLSVMLGYFQFEIAGTAKFVRIWHDKKDRAFIKIRKKVRTN